MSAEFTPLAITGLGCLFPKAQGPGAYWANIKNAIDCITEVPPTHWNPDEYYDPDPKSPDRTYARRGGFLDAIDFNPLEFGIAPRDLEAIDTSQLLGLVAAKQALQDAGLLGPESGSEGRSSFRTDPSRISVILGVTGTLELVVPLGARLGHPKWRKAMKDAGIPDDAIDDAVARISESYVAWQENSFPGLLGNVVAGRIANRLDLGGTNCVVDAACASSLSAVHLAALELQSGRADVVVTGGVDTFNDIFMYMCFSKTPALSPTGDAKPFDAHGDGTILGEGLGIVILKRLADAERDGDRIYAVLRSIGSSSDGKGQAIYAPSAAGQMRALRNAYALAGITPDTIELVEAHGTGTKVGDATEATALIEVFRSAAPSQESELQAPWCALGSVKSQIGHTKAAAGAASLIKATLALYFKVLPPTLKVKEPVEPLKAPNSPFYINTLPRPWLAKPSHPRRAAVSAFGFGGSNFHAVLEEHRRSKTAVDWDGSVEIVALAADSPEQLQQALDSLPLADWREFAVAAENSRSTFRPEAPYRLTFAVHRERTDRPKLVQAARAQLRSSPHASSWQLPEGAFFGCGPAAGKLAVLFPGQGSQSVGMLRDLACQFPEILESLTLADRAASVASRIYPPSAFDRQAQQAQESALRDTRVAQPALGSVSYGAWKVLRDRFGLVAEAYAGHSYGELPALCAAGCFGEPELMALSRLRGELMSQGADPSDPGGMVAVSAPSEKVQNILSEQGLRLTVANHNSPSQVVLAGSSSEIEQAARHFTAMGIAAKLLPVSAAFHSEYVASAAKPFRQMLDAVDVHPPRTPVFSNTLASPYPEEIVPIKDLLSEQLAKPVNFVGLIHAMLAAGIRTFVEVGPGTVLTRLVDAILKDPSTRSELSSNASAMALDASSGKRPGVFDLALLLARLAASGHSVRLTAWEAESLCRPQMTEKKPGLTIPICGANYVQPRTQRPPRAARPNPSQPTQTPNSQTPQTLPMPEKLNANGSPANWDSNWLSHALQLTQQTLATLQQLQEQSAQLHRQFLESQESAQRTIQALVEQQARLLGLSDRPASPAPPPLPERQFPAPPAMPPAAVAVNTAQAAMTPPAGQQTPRLSHRPEPVKPEPLKAAPAAQTASANVVPSPAASAKPRLTPADVAQTLLAVVSEKTGYPIESLDLSLTLDADLGIDSIKRVEILSAIQEKLPDAPVVKPEHLGTLQTLNDVVSFLTSGAGADNEAAKRAELEPPLTQALAADRLVLLTRDDLPPPPPSAVTPIVPIHSPPDCTADPDRVRQVLLECISEKTGYPIDSLDMTLSLDADLGIDSIKRVEILSAVQERLPDAPTVKPEHLGTLQTLQDVANYLAGSGGTLPAATSLPEPPAPDTEQVSSIHPVIPSDSTLKLPGPGSADKNSPAVATASASLAGAQIPQESLSPEGTNESDRLADALRSVVPPRPSLELIERSILQTVDLDPQMPRSRVELAPGSEIWVVGEAGRLTEAVVERLMERGYYARPMVWAGPGANKPLSPLGGLILLAPLFPGPESGLNRLGFQWVQQVAGKLRQAGRQSGAVLAAVTRLDGCFGLHQLSPDADPTSGGLAGLVKTARHEWPEVTCKVIDLDANYHDDDLAAKALVEEILTTGPIEVGIAATHRCALELARTVRRPAGRSLDLTAKDVVIVTGGARGVTAEATAALAELYPCTFILTGRTPPPAPEPEWLKGLQNEAEMKAAISRHLGPEAGPRKVGDYYQHVVHQREIQRTLQRVEASGAKVVYYAVDVTSGRAVADLLQKVQLKHGPVTALIHGAGVLADKRIEDLTLEQFDQVYATKVDGLRNFLDLLTNEELKAIVLFSSTTARFGRTGQAAYAVANEVLNKTAQVESRRRPGCRVVAINWGPWEGGMVNAGLRKLFESEGIGLIPLKEGATFLVNELTAAGRAVEVVALAKKRPKTDPAGTAMYGPSTPPQPAIISALNSPGAPLSPSSSAGGSASSTGPIPEMHQVFERTIDVESHPVLRSHVLDGRAVLPMALHLEWLAHAALHGHPGLVFHGFNDLRITQGVTIDPGSSPVIRALAGKAIKQDKQFLVPVELRGRRRDGRELLHSRAEIVLVAALPKAVGPDRAPEVIPYSHSLDDVYEEFLFHGPDLRGIEQIVGVSEVAFIGRAYPAPPPSEWFQNPLRSHWVADPLVLDTSFQMMILWSLHQHHSGSIPCFAGRYRQYRRSFPLSPVTIVIRVRRDNGQYARADIDYLDSENHLVAQMQDYECVIEQTLNQAFRRNQLGMTRA